MKHPLNSVSKALQQLLDEIDDKSKTRQVSTI
jgi:hypothetical protein